MGPEEPGFGFHPRDERATQGRILVDIGEQQIAGPDIRIIAAPFVFDPVDLGIEYRQVTTCDGAGGPYVHVQRTIGVVRHSFVIKKGLRGRAGTGVTAADLLLVTGGQRAVHVVIDDPEVGVRIPVKGSQVDLFATKRSYYKEYGEIRFV